MPLSIVRCMNGTSDAVGVVRIDWNTQHDTERTGQENALEMHEGIYDALWHSSYSNNSIDHLRLRILVVLWCFSLRPCHCTTCTKNRHFVWTFAPQTHLLNATAVIFNNSLQNRYGSWRRLGVRFLGPGCAKPLESPFSATGSQHSTPATQSLMELSRGFRSGLKGGHKFLDGKLSLLLSESCVLALLCTGALSCWKIQLPGA